MLEPWTPATIIHGTIAVLALVLGSFNAFRTVRGDPLHKAVGRTWAGLMILISVTGLIIVARLSLEDFDPIDYFLTGLAIWTIISISTGVLAARAHKIILHKTFMLGTYVGLLGATIGVVAVPPDLCHHISLHIQ